MSDLHQTPFLSRPLPQGSRQVVSIRQACKLLTVANISDTQVSIAYKILRVYLKQLVEQKVPPQLGEWLSSLRAWTILYMHTFTAYG